MYSIFGGMGTGLNPAAQCCGRCSCLNNVSVAEYQHQLFEYFQRQSAEHERRQLEAQRWIDDVAGQIRRG